MEAEKQLDEDSRTELASPRNIFLTSCQSSAKGCVFIVILALHRRGVDSPDCVVEQSDEKQDDMLAAELFDAGSDGLTNEFIVLSGRGKLVFASEVDPALGSTDLSISPWACCSWIVLMMVVGRSEDKMATDRGWPCTAESDDSAISAMSEMQ